MRKFLYKEDFPSSDENSVVEISPMHILIKKDSQIV